MTKQETVEWLAENVVGQGRTLGLIQEHGKGLDKVEYSQALLVISQHPTFFFAMWDAVIDRGYVYVSHCMTVNEEWQCSLAKQYQGENTPVMCYGKNRYEAFYKAVYQAMK